MSYQGPIGYVGTQGVQGCTGQPGLQGTPYGPPGKTFYVGGTLSYSTLSSSVAISDTSASGTYYYCSSNVATIDVSAYTPNPSTDSGAFWTFKNNTGSNATFTFLPPTGSTGLPTSNSTGGGAYYNGNPSATSFNVPNGNGFTLVYSSDPVSSIQYFIVI